MVVALKEQSCSAWATALFDVCFAIDLLPFLRFRRYVHLNTLAIFRQWPLRRRRGFSAPSEAAGCKICQNFSQVTGGRQNHWREHWRKSEPALARSEENRV